MALRLLSTVMVCALIATGCGDQKNAMAPTLSPTPSASPAPSPPGPSPSPAPTSPFFDQAINGEVASFGVTQHLLSVPQSGNLTATLNWTNPAIDLDLYLTDASCNEYPPGRCTILATSDATSGTSEQVNKPVTAGTEVKLWVDNFSFTGTTYSLRARID